MRFGYITIFCLFQSGCAFVPLSTEPPLPYDKIATIQLNTSDKKSIAKLLGQADITRDSDSIWIYAKGQRAAMFFAASMSGGGGAYLYNYNWLFLHFDEQNKLIDKELIDEKYGCTKSGYCLHSGWYHRKKIYGLVNEKTVLLQPAILRKISEINPGFCRLYIYDVGESDWLPGYWPISINIDSYGPIVTDEKTYAYIELPSGRVTVTLTEGQPYTTIRNNSEFECPSMHNKYLGMSLTVKDGTFKYTDDKSDPLRFTQYLNIFEVNPDVSTKVLNNRRMIVNP